MLDKTTTRKLMQAVASLGPAACLIKLAADTQGAGDGQLEGGVESAVVLVTAWISLCGFSAAGFGSNHQDISRKYSGILYGLSNGLASIAASGAPPPPAACCRLAAALYWVCIWFLRLPTFIDPLASVLTPPSLSPNPRPPPAPPYPPPPPCSVHLRHRPGAACHPRLVAGV